MKINIFPDPNTLADAVADRFINTSQSSILATGRFNVALAGGSTPQAAYHRIASRGKKELVNWSLVQIFWGDERCVPPEHPESNYRMAYEALLDHIPIPVENIHRMAGEWLPFEAANHYQEILESNLGPSQRFDLVILGMGIDSHTASLFPGTAALRKTSRWVKANYVDKLAAWRLTLTPSIINQARNIVFLISGENKAEALHHVISGKFQPHQYPSQFIKPTSGKIYYYIDTGAAKRIA